MALQQKSTTIGAYTYTTTQLDAVRGRRVFMRLTRILGPAFAELDQKDEGSLSRAFGTALKLLSEDDLDFFCDTFAAMTSVKGASMKGEPQLDSIFAIHFAADYGAMTAWLVWCMKVNFGSFFDHASLLVGPQAKA